MTNSISNTDEIIDSRDVIARIAELESERDDWEDEDGKEWAEENPDEAEELEKLQAFAEEAEDYASDWRYGAMLINGDYFTEYCKELLNDIGELPRDLPDYIVIDWDATADNLKVDYTEVDFDGQTYLVR